MKDALAPSVALAVEVVHSTGPGPSDDAYVKILALEPSFLALEDWFCPRV